MFVPLSLPLFPGVRVSRQSCARVLAVRQRNRPEALILSVGGRLRRMENKRSLQLERTDSLWPFKGRTPASDDRSPRQR